MWTGAVRSLRRRGVLGTVRAMLTAEKYCRAVRGKCGIEIGGPTEMFCRFLPLYRALSRLDNCVFSPDTIWEGHREPRSPYLFYPDKPPGVNYVCEASELSFIPDQQYDFVLSCHSLEHCANPIKALKEWHRVSRKYLILLLPNYRLTFDHRREPTPLAHMINDYVRGIGEDDLTHLPEILELHDLSRDPKSGSLEDFRERSLSNICNRCLHHHVFNDQNASELLAYAGFKIVAFDEMEDSLVFLASKVQ